MDPRRRLDALRERPLGEVWREELRARLALIQPEANSTTEDSENTEEYLRPGVGLMAGGGGAGTG